MKRLVLAFMLLPSIAAAQQIDPVTSGAQAMALDGGSMFIRMAGQIAQDQRQIAGLQKNVLDLTAERDKLKAGDAKQSAEVPTKP